MPLKVSRKGNVDNKLRALDVAMRRALIVGGNRVALTAVAIMEQERPGTIATGQTGRTITVSKVQQGVLARVGGRVMFVTVGPRTDYAKWGIGTGRAPGTPPPLRAIYNWVREKPGGGSMTEPERWAMARAVQKTIAAEGTTPYFVLERALSIERPFLNRAIQAGVRNALLT